MRRFLAGLLVVLLTLSACGPLPRPFGRSDEAAESALAQNIYFEGVELLPLTGTTPPMGKLLAEAVIKRLEKDYEIPAAMGGLDRSRFVLSGHVIDNEGNRDARSLISIDWQLAVRGGDVISAFTEDVKTDRTAWDYGSAPLINQIGIDISTRVAKLILGDRFGKAGEDKTLGRSGIYIGAVSGAPGDGNSALRRAIAVALGGGGVRIMADAEKALFKLNASVEMGKPENGAQSIRILWLVTDVDGKTLGRIEQANAVAAGSLDQRWGQTAAFVAAAALEGIILAVERNDPTKLRVPDLGSGSRRPALSPSMPPGPDLPQVPGRAPPPPG
ncbi:MAG: hypothetical protein WD075_02100 [Rhodospirillales bacterium]